MRFTGKADTDVNGKCDNCLYYEPLFKQLYSMQTKHCRGRCGLNKKYKQRTETCKKFLQVEKECEVMSIDYSKYKTNTHILQLRRNGIQRIQTVTILQTVNRPMNPTDQEIIEDILHTNFSGHELIGWDIVEDSHALQTMLINEDYQIEV